MNPAKITIQGNYWDCQIYRGRLYLFTINGTVKTIKWNDLIDSLQTEDFINVALSYAFKNGRNLYHPELTDLFRDTDIRNLLATKFDFLSTRNFSISEELLNQFLIAEQDSPFDELHTDSEVLSNKLYVLTHNSLESVAVHTTSKRYPVERIPKKHFDLFGFTLRANRFARLAVSAGDDGLMEYNGSSSYNWSYHNAKRMVQVSSRHSSFADYSFLSIYNSSLAGDSFMSYYTWDDNMKRKRPERIKINEFDEAVIFQTHLKNSYLSWGSNEKIYRAVEGGLEMVRFNNYAKPGEPIFSTTKFIPLQAWKGKVLSAAVAYFGTVLHCENAVVVMLSDGSFYNIPGEISRVRIFPRSLNYENHLHIIHEDKLEIYSFNNDYFVDQKSKDFGFAYKPSKTFGRRYNQYERDEDYYDFEDLEEDDKNDQSNSSIDPKDLPF
jgi:hypothetical protein